MGGGQGWEERRRGKRAEVSYAVHTVHCHSSVSGRNVLCGSYCALSLFGLGQKCLMRFILCIVTLWSRVLKGDLPWSTLWLLGRATAAEVFMPALSWHGGWTPGWSSQLFPWLPTSCLLLIKSSWAVRYLHWPCLASRRIRSLRSAGGGHSFIPLWLSTFWLKLLQTLVPSDLEAWLRCHTIKPPVPGSLSQFCECPRCIPFHWVCVDRKASYTLSHRCIGVVWEKRDVEWDTDFRPSSLLKSLHFQILPTSAFNSVMFEKVNRQGL